MRLSFVDFYFTFVWYWKLDRSAVAEVILHIADHLPWEKERCDPLKDVADFTGSRLSWRTSLNNLGMASAKHLWNF